MNDIELASLKLAFLIKIIFSWLILLPTSVIITGKLLSKPIKLASDSKQLLKINLKIFHVEANGGEVILGFACLIIVIFFVAIVGGVQTYELVKASFGIDPGHFHAICFFSAMVSVILSTFLFIAHYIITVVFKTSFVEDQEKYEEKIESLVKKGQGK